MYSTRPVKTLTLAPVTKPGLSTDGELLAEARTRQAGLNDAALFDAALTALVRASRNAEIDASYASYDEHPLDEADEWGDLASFRDGAAAS